MQDACGGARPSSAPRRDLVHSEHDGKLLTVKKAELGTFFFAKRKFDDKVDYQDAKNGPQGLLPTLRGSARPSGRDPAPASLSGVRVLPGLALSLPQTARRASPGGGHQSGVSLQAIPGSGTRRGPAGWGDPRDGHRGLRGGNHGHLSNRTTASSSQRKPSTGSPATTGRVASSACTWSSPPTPPSLSTAPTWRPRRTPKERAISRESSASACPTAMPSSSINRCTRETGGSDSPTAPNPPPSKPPDSLGREQAVRGRLHHLVR